MLSPLQVKEHRLAEFSLKPITETNHVESDSDVVSCRHGILCHQNPNDENHWNLRLKVELINTKENPSSQYVGLVEAVGEFQVHPEYPADKAETLVRISGGSVLYGAIREWVAIVSARSINGVLELPTVDTRSFLPSEEPKKAAPKKKAAKKKPAAKKK